ncbi:pentatricopeptide repeat-containing protein At3g18110, chloroplastic [Cynara cardunculus var. scolymus]|uniref:Pentatricopeptide repeat-containing protein n=1 Tax=Cynara cardunculus var. scolymus TaxID=59895 RepID=A0A118JZE5_CYNCS|nr:pentatricopeptide repeat-containing protein At3g18110, chloroplastic [Cynara cardunculus var. scolymus]XP_024977031.1 pentatricopeptide repeat-containing protein At3g18110, chloroplastic [Cynara cardunculus var. scolymus]KVH99357.1 Pentatricopeptide repeat-containing protein [Cynara cardunculus var. scolymus]
MNLKHFLSRLTINKVSRFNGRRTPSWNYREFCTVRCISPLLYPQETRKAYSLFGKPKTQMAHSLFYRFIHSGRETVLSGAKDVVNVSVDTEEDDAVMNEFLSRFVWIMRGKLTEVYTNADKKEVDAMLQIIVGKVISEMEEGNIEHFIDSAAASASQDFSEDLWKTVWEVSNVVLEDMKKAKKKEKMKSFLQSEEVKDMTRFAGEIGIRGDMLRELRFKWAREKLEDSEFYESLELMRQEAKEPEANLSEVETEICEASKNNCVEEEDDAQVVSLPKRSGKIKYQIYGLDLSKQKWAELAEQLGETGRSIWPQEPKPISGKCKSVTEKILSLQVDDDPSPLIAEWIELLQPSKVDWIALLDRLKEKNDQLYLKVAELLLDEESFQSNVRDYSQLVDVHAKHNKLDDAERIMKKMNEKGIIPDILTKTTMVHMYSKAGNLNLAKDAFESLRSQGFQPDLKVYNSMIMAYVNAGDQKSGEALMRDLEAKNFKPSEDTYLALLRAYAEHADPIGASRISTQMEFAGYQPSLESCTCLVEAYSRKGNPDQARKHFDDIIKLGYKPDDKCIARMIAAYANKNLLDKGLHLLLQLEKDGIEHSVATYAVLVDWLGKLQLIDEVEDLLGKFTEKGVSPSLDVHISLCDMYARAQEEKKTLQALGVLEANKDQLRHEEFEKIISALVAGGFWKDAERFSNLMTAQGFTTSNQLSVTLKASQTFGRMKSSMK